MRDYEGWKTEDFEVFKKWIDKTFYPICDDFWITTLILQPFRAG